MGLKQWSHGASNETAGLIESLLYLKASFEEINLEREV